MPDPSAIAEILLPIFVALSPLTVLPIFLSMTEGMESRAMQRLARRAVLTGLVISVAIVWLGAVIFRALSITVDDLRIAGGLILLVLAIYDLLFNRERRKQSDADEDPGVVPLGTPIIVGPATMATCLVLADAYGKTLVLIALAVNLTLVGLILHFAGPISRVIPSSGARAFGKVMSLFLAAIAVAMVRSGLERFLR